MYYPKGVCSISEYNKYIQTDEYKRLKNKLNYLFSSSDIKKQKRNILNRFKNYQEIKETRDVTMESFDRCLSFKLELVRDKTLFQICLNLSLLIPYYTIYILKNDIELEPYKWLDVPKRDQKSEIELFGTEMKLLSNVVEEITLYTKIPEYIVKLNVSDLSYADVGIGYFTFMNAFFLDNIEL